LTSAVLVGILSQPSDLLRHSEMLSDRQRRLMLALALAVVGLCAGIFWGRARLHERPTRASATRRGEPHAVAAEESSLPSDYGDAADEEQRPAGDPTSAVTDPTKQASEDAENQEQTEKADGAEAHSQTDQPLTEERFVEIAAKIRVWQRAIANTPEGQHRLEELVLALLESEGLTRADLAAFGRGLNEEDAERLDDKVEQRVAEIGHRRFRVRARETDGSRVLKQDPPDKDPDNGAP